MTSASGKPIPASGNSKSNYDVAIIGAGVIGCAVARRFTLEGARVAVLEKSTEVLDGASKGNSGILHTGFDALPDSLESRCIQAGYQEYLSVYQQLNLPILPCAAVVVAWTEAEEEKLDAILARARDNGVNNVTMLGREELRRREPHLSSHARAAVLVPDESVIDPWTAPHMYLRQAMDNGARLYRNTEVRRCSFANELWRIQTSGAEVTASFVINCAGLFGDQVDRQLFGDNSFTIKPRKGQFVVFDKAAAALVNAILLPVPSPTTKGIVICRTSYGNVLVGPTAEEQQSRTDASVDHDTLLMLRNKASELVPGLGKFDVTATYAGIRPATEYKDYRITAYRKHHAITVGGIRSTGLSSALGIARYVFELYAGTGVQHGAVENPICNPCEFPLASDTERDWRKPGNGGIICHCERVTRREIEASLSGKLKPNSLDGLKRQTRATMGSLPGILLFGGAVRNDNRSF